MTTEREVADAVNAGRDSLRPPLRWFAAAMERKLKANDHKGGWKRYHSAALLARIMDELGEVLRLATSPGSQAVNVWIVNTLRARIFATSSPTKNPDALISELADVANFCMMLADNVYRQAHPEDSGHDD